MFFPSSYFLSKESGGFATAFKYNLSKYLDRKASSTMVKSPLSVKSKIFMSAASETIFNTGGNFALAPLVLDFYFHYFWRQKILSQDYQEVLLGTHHFRMCSFSLLSYLPGKHLALIDEDLDNVPTFSTRSAY